MWKYNSTDIAALEKYSGSDRIASCWYASSGFFADLNLTDGQTRRVALYFLDWDAIGRKGSVTISDAETGAQLSLQPLTDFRSGVWLVWDIKGHVKVSVSNSAGNAVVT